MSVRVWPGVLPHDALMLSSLPVLSHWNCALLIIAHQLTQPRLLTVWPDWEWCPLDELCRCWTEPPQAAVVCHHNLSPAKPLSHLGELLAGKWSWQGVMVGSAANVSPAGNVMGFPQWNTPCAFAVDFGECWIFLSLLVLVHWGKVK